MTISIFKNFPIRLDWLCYTLDSKAHAWRKQVTLQLYQNNTQYCLLLTIETDAYMWALLSPSNKRKAHFINSAIFICFFQFALFHFNFQAIFILLSSKLLKRTSFAIQFEIRLNVKFSTFQCWHHWRTLLCAITLCVCYYHGWLWHWQFAMGLIKLCLWLSFSYYIYSEWSNFFRLNFAKKPIDHLICVEL